MIASTTRSPRFLYSTSRTADGVVEAMPNDVEAAASGRPLADIGETPPSDVEWEALTAGLTSHSAFATAAWLRAWGNAFLPHEQWAPPLHYLTVRDRRARLKAIVPFAVQRRFGISISALGGFYWPFRAPIIPDCCRADEMVAMVRALTESSSTLAIRLGPVPETHVGMTGFNVALESEGWHMTATTLGQTYDVELPDTWAELERGLGKNLRTKTKYYERKLPRDGALEIRCEKSSLGSSWPNVLCDLTAIEQRSWQHKEGGKPRFAGEANQAFWSQVLADPKLQRMACTWIMYFNRAPVSFCFCLDCGSTRHIIANHYAEYVHSYSTGSVLYRHVFQDAVESPAIHSVNIGAGDSGYKTRWGAQPSFKLIDWFAFRPGAGGRLLELANQLR
jgi:hypothetical protein